MLRLSSLIVATALMVSPAVAHTGIGETSGVAHGLAHPLGSLDHVLAMVAVGFFAALLGGRALWLVPAAFAAMMAVGGATGMAGISLPFVEVGIGLSVVALGAAIALRLDPPLAAAMAVVGVFAIFHGYAHVAEMPDTASGLGYGAGFILATTILHGAGVGLGLTTERIGAPGGMRVARALGGAIALAGVVLLSQLV